MKRCPKCKTRVSTVPTFDESYLAVCENPHCDYERSFGLIYDRKEYSRLIRKLSAVETEIEESR